MTNIEFGSANLDFTLFAQDLKDGKTLSLKLPNGKGELFVDHLQPFICLYRPPVDRSDPGTRQLLSGQTAYLVADPLRQSLPETRKVVAQLVDTMCQIYGAALVIEIWSASNSALDAMGPEEAPARFRIIAEQHGVSRETIAALERALLSMRSTPKVEIAVEYCSGASPPGMQPVLSERSEARDDIFLMGLEIPPLFRVPKSSEVIPGVLRTFTRDVGRALRNAFYAFSHTHARNRPAHFHELGPRAMGPEVTEVDKGFSAVSDTFDLLLFVTPVNAEVSFQRFISNGCAAEPEFLYRPVTVDPGALKFQLYQVPLETIEDPALHYVYSAQRDELDRQITMLSDRGSPRFLLESQQVFGGADEALTQASHDILDRLETKVDIPSNRDVVSAQDFALLAEEELAYYRELMPELPARVELREDIPGVLVSKGNFLVGATTSVARDRVNSLIQHEVGTHILTYYNGLQQPLSQFHSGMPGYEETQEGLAVLSEYLCGGFSAARLRTLAGRVVAVDCMTRGADFIETYRVLASTYDFGERDAFTISMRAYRGGGLTKDVVYLRGLVALLDYLGAGNAFDDLLLGKVALEHMEIVEELRWRKILTPGPLRPRYLEDAATQDRLEALLSGARVTDLVNGGCP